MDTLSESHEDFRDLQRFSRSFLSARHLSSPTSWPSASVEQGAVNAQVSQNIFRCLQVLSTFHASKLKKKLTTDKSDLGKYTTTTVPDKLQQTQVFASLLGRDPLPER